MRILRWFGIKLASLFCGGNAMMKQALAGSMLDELNLVRNQIVERIDEYTRLHALMTGFENHYLSYVLMPSYQLQQTIQMGNYLEQEYNRISMAIQQGQLTDREELESEIRSTLHHADFAFGYLPRESPYQSLGSPNPFDLAPQDSSFTLTENQKKKLMKEFKKIVLPKVHADTSDAPFEVFNTVFEAYKKKDYLLMAAFVIQYRGELPPPAEDLGVFLEMAPLYREEYDGVLNGLQERLRALNEDPTASRLENGEQVLLQMKKQNQELRKSAFQHAERVLLLRNCLEELIQSRISSKGVN